MLSSFIKSRKFLDINIKGILIQNKDKFNSINNPKLSVIIPIYNSQSFIYRAIKSVQNQNILEIEIILINDYSTDNTSTTIMKFKNEDPRIIIINNKKNMGILYSRSIGALSAKGNFIFSLDNDDMFLNNNIISTIINISNKNDFDIVEFKGILSFNGINLKDYSKIKDIYLSNHKINQVLLQPELSFYPIKTGKNFGQYRLNSVYLWNKCIKTSIYQKALQKLTKEKYSRYMLAYEDVLAVFIIFNVANSYIFVGIYGIYHIHRKGSAYSLTDSYKRSIKELYLADAVISFSKNLTFHQILISYLLYRVLSLKLLKKLIENKQVKKLLYDCLDIFLNSFYISKEYKNKIINKGNSLEFCDYINFRKK